MQSSTIKSITSVLREAEVFVQLYLNVYVLYLSKNCVDKAQMTAWYFSSVTYDYLVYTKTLDLNFLTNHIFPCSFAGSTSAGILILE